MIGLTIPDRASLPTSPPRRVRVSRAVFRAVITLHALSVFAQPVLAGRFLNGDVSVLQAHRLNGIAVGALGIAQLLIALAHWRIGAGRRWPVAACLALALADPAQIYLGFNRFVGLHVSLGAGIVAATLLLLVSAWRPGFTVHGNRSMGRNEQ